MQALLDCSLIMCFTASDDHLPQNNTENIPISGNVFNCIVFLKHSSSFLKSLYLYKYQNLIFMNLLIT